MIKSKKILALGADRRARPRRRSLRQRRRRQRTTEPARHRGIGGEHAADTEAPPHRRTDAAPAGRQRAPAGSDAPAGEATARSASCTTSPVAATSRSTTPLAPASTRPSPTSASPHPRAPRPATATAPSASQGSVDEGNDLVVGVGFLFGDSITAAAAADPDTNFAIVDSVVEAAERGVARLRRGAGLVPRRCRCGTEEPDRHHRLHRWRRERTHQEVRGRLHRWCHGRQP